MTCSQFYLNSNRPIMAEGELRQELELLQQELNRIRRKVLAR